MKTYIRKGFGFGLTSGIITTLGLLIGLAYSTQSKKVVLGGIILIAVADALSDALGMHVSEEAGSKTTTGKQIWVSTVSTTVFKFIFALSFIIPVLLLSLQQAVLASIIWGILLLSGFSYYVARKRKESPSWAVSEHLLIAIIVILITYFLGNWISNWAI